MVTVSPFLSVITLSVNGLTSPFKSHGVAECIKKTHNIQLCALYKRLILVLSITNRLKVKGEKSISHINGNQKRRGYVISDKIDFKTKTITETKKELYNDKRVNSPERYNSNKYICTQHQSTQIYKANIKELKEEIVI